MFPHCEYSKYYPINTETFTYTHNLELLKSLSSFDTIGNKLKYYRKHLNLTQNDLSLISGLERCTILRIENDQVAPNIETCRKLANALNIPPSYIYDEYLSFIDSDYPAFLKALRRKLNLTQPQLAQKLGLTKKTISSWERKVAFPSAENYKLLCEYISKGNL